VLSRAVAASAVLGALLAAGCGGDDGNGELSADEFRQRANAICADHTRKLDTVDPPSSPDDLARFVDDALPIMEEGTQELSALDPPAEFEDDWSRVVEINAQNLETMQEARNAFHDGDVEEAKRLIAEAGEHTDESNRLAQKLGLTKCDQEPD
jgi:hypothetical protein